MNKKQIKALIIEYLEFTPSKSCSFVAICLLCDYFKLKVTDLTTILNEMYCEGDIEILFDESYIAMTTIKLNTTFKLLK